MAAKDKAPGKVWIIIGPEGECFPGVHTSWGAADHEKREYPSRGQAYPPGSLIKSYLEKPYNPHKVNGRQIDRRS